MNNTNFSDSLLSAWLDGELAAPERAPERERVEAWLRDHPEDAARARLLAADGELLRARLAPALDEPVPEHLTRLVWRRSARPRWALAASAAGLLLLGGLVGAALGWQAQSRNQQAAAAAARQATASAAGWVERAVYAHAIYTNERRHPVEVRAQEEHLSRWLTARIQLPVKLFDLQAQGFELVGGRLLPDGAGKSAQLMYQDAQGGRVTVYLRKPDDGTEAAFRYERQGELGLFYWVESGLGYALVGALPKEKLLALSQAIYEQHPPPLPAAPAAATGSSPAASSALRPPAS